MISLLNDNQTTLLLIELKKNTSAVPSSLAVKAKHLGDSKCFCLLMEKYLDRPYLPCKDEKVGHRHFMDKKEGLDRKQTKPAMNQYRENKGKNSIIYTHPYEF